MIAGAKVATTVIRRAARRATVIAAGRDIPVVAKMMSQKTVKGIVRLRTSVDFALGEVR